MSDEKQNQGSALTLEQTYYIVFRYKFWILGGLLLGLIAGGVIFFTTPSVYRSEAKLLVRYITETTVLDPSTAGGRVVMPDSRGENIINSEIEIIESRDLVEKIVDKIGMADLSAHSADKDQRTMAIASILRNLMIEVPKHSNVICIYYDGSTPAMAQRILALLVDGYLEKQMEIHRSAAAYDFLSQQSDQIRIKLSDTEEELRKLKDQAGIVSIDDTKKVLATRMEDLKRALRESDANLAGAKARLKVTRPLAGEPEATSATTGSVEGVLRNYDRLMRLHQRESELLAIYTEDSIPVQNIREQIEDARKDFAASGGDRAYVPGPGASTNFLASAVLPEEAEVAELEAKAAVLQSQLDLTVTEARKVDDMEGRVVQLERNKQIQEDHYMYFTRGLEQARIDEALDAGKISNISVVQPASLQTVPLRPNMWRNIMLAIGIGLVGGFGAAFLKDTLLDQTVKRPRDVRDMLGLTMLLSIPLISKNGKARAAVGEGRGSASSADGPSAHVHEGLVDYCEALRDRLLATMGEPGDAPQFIGVTGCTVGAGVTTLASGLALTLARSGEERVLLVDADPGRASTHRVFGVSPSGALVDILSDQKGNTAIVERNVFVLSSSGKDTDVALSMSRRFGDVMRQVRESNYRYVVMDLPPISQAGSTVRIAGQLHSIVLVIEAEKDHRDSVQRARDLLAQVNARLTGVILNKTRSWVPPWLHPMY